MKRIYLLILLALPLVTFAQKRLIPIVPNPSNVNIIESESFSLPNNFSVNSPRSMQDLSKLLIEDIKFFTKKSGKSSSSSKATIVLKHDESLEDERYKLDVTQSQVVISASTYKGMSYGVTSFLQLLDVDNNNTPCVSIDDKPAFWYRGFMLDVARQWTEVQTIKQCIDLCRWYKIPFMQIHLSDDQSFTFPSKTYPKLASKDRQYTIKELKFLVEYAKQRGVTLIPEFDLPGHSSIMRKNMPELFGKNEWSVIDMVSEEACKAIEIVTKEIMDVFYTSPYFHIGADEAWLGNYEKLPHVKEAVKERGFDNAHDLQLEFVVRMHEFIKSQGKQTLVWESFQDNGSRKVQIPTELTVMAWETLYQHPQSLIDNGYNIISAPWKPFYVCPGFRWSPEYIYNHNARRFENHWNVTPAFLSPIQLESNKQIMGGQMCAWEMDDPSFFISLHTRIPALSEVLWNDNNKTSFEDYQNRITVADNKVMKIAFPAYNSSNGFKDIDKYNLDDSRVYHFTDKGTIKLEPMDKGDYITYTTDKSMPTAKSTRLPSELVIDTDSFIKFAIFNSKGQIKGYRSAHYEHRPIDVINMGEMLPVRDRNIGMARRKELFNNTVSVAIVNGLPNSTIHYTLDNTNPTMESPKYIDPITINKTTRVRARCFVDGKPVGQEFACYYNKYNYSKSLSTNKPVYINKIGETSKLTNLIVDGEVNIDYYWGAKAPESVIVDLEATQELNAVRLYTFWDNNRYYQYTIEVSKDGKNWTLVADGSKNTTKSTDKGAIHIFEKPIDGRYVKVNMLKNSINAHIHIVELKVY